MLKVKNLSPKLWTLERGINPPAKKGDAGYDLFARKIIKCNLFSVWYDTQIAVEIPEGYVGLLVPRSSITNKSELTLANSVGIIDSNYRGTVQVRFNRTLKGFFTMGKYNLGERIAQLVIVPFIAPEIKLVDSLSETTRGEDGFGHTGK